MYNRNNLLAHLITGTDKDNSREELKGVLFSKDKTVATDSYTLIKIKNLPEMTEQCKEAPSCVKVAGSVLKKGYIIPANAVKKALTNVNEINNSDLPILSNVFLSNHTNAKSSELVSTNLEKMDKVEVKNIGGEYPDFNKVIPTGKAKARVVLDITKLKKVVDTIAKMDCGETINNPVTLEFFGEEKPFVIKRDNRNLQKITGLIMPIRE
jgi:DNA polymerase III sliding clamp (beta) subunit (PCNA family)